ncbi:hypothetical protein Nepgr_028684 [Nepenthes gracilis]|uniref:Uncharacterized protein n=1 Tax=Nepenthes gracilis TaxID=150966 RepID=A0AAD3TDG7_NEPGR|nr:hypothetical protein Nepgr_028684 [Nepenthes gracilis]
MPSGAKKKKAAKKMLQKEAHKISKNGTRPQENDEPKSLSERESGVGEVEETAIIEEGGHEDAKEASLPAENAVDITGEVKLEDTENIDVDVDDIIKETPDEDRSVENGISGSICLDDNKVAAENEQPALSASEYLPKEAAGGERIASVEGVYNSFGEGIFYVESVKKAFTLPEEEDIVSDLKENGNEVFQLSDEKNRVSPIMTDLKPEKVEKEVISVLDEYSVEKLPEATGSPVATTSRWVAGDDVKASETFEKFVDQSAAPAVDTSYVADDVKDLTTKEQTEGQTGASAVNTDREVNDVQDLKTYEHSEEHTGYVHENLEGQTSISTAPPALQRASWRNCCGLFELFMGSNR